MKRKFLSLLLVAAMVLMLFPMTALATEPEFAGGDGSPTGTGLGPYQITTAAQLNNVRNHLGAHFILVNDIDLTSYLSAAGPGFNGGAGWVPVGTPGTPFVGTFDGNEKFIAGLHAYRDASNYIGLFGYTGDTAVIRDVGLENANVTGKEYVGSLVGYNRGSVSSSFVTGNLVAGRYGGSLIGQNEGSVVDSYAAGDVEQNIFWVTSSSFLGGLVGRNSGTIEKSYATGAVTGGFWRIGGLAGENSGSVTECYAAGGVGSAEIEYTGGLVGENIGSSNIIRSYYNTQTTRRNDTGKGIPLTSAQMMQSGSFEGWNFTPETGDWAINAGASYPYLQSIVPDLLPNAPAPPALTVNTSIVGFAGQEWWVIGYNDGSSNTGVYSDTANSATLLVKGGDPYGRTPFRLKSDTAADGWTLFPSSYNSGWPTNIVGDGKYYEGTFTTLPWEYYDSNLQRYMEALTTADTAVFPAKEAALINARTLAASVIADILGPEVPGQKLWPLSIQEFMAIGNSTVCSYGTYWWIRPYGYNGTKLIDKDGSNEWSENIDKATRAARPALNLNLSSVLFTSAASGANAKPTVVGGNLTAAEAPTGAVKFTMLTTGDTVNVLATTAQSAQSSSVLSFGYSGATTGTNQYVSCILVNSANEVTHYGKLADSSGAAGGTFSILLAEVADGTYTLKIFSEEANGDNYTDFCGEPIAMTVAVASGIGAVSGFTAGGGTIDDTAPLLTAGTVNRSSDATATVRFTSNETGQYYYEVVEDEAAQPAIATSGAGTACDASEQTIGLTALTAGAKDIYIVVKDTVGNVSNMLKIDIPVSTYSVTYNINGGGGIAPNESDKAAGATFTAATADTLTAPSGKRFKEWNTAADGSGTAYAAGATVTMPANNLVLYAIWENIPSNSSRGGTPAPATPAAPGGTIAAPAPALNQSTGVAATQISSPALNAALASAVQDSTGKKTVEITVPPVQGAAGYETSLPASALSSGTDTQVAINTAVANVTLPGNMLSGTGITGDAGLTIGTGDKSNLPDEVKAAIGDRPLIQLSLSVDGRQTDWNNPDAPVTVSVPYTPTAEELANPESIVVWYIDGLGNAVSVPNGRYDPATGTVIANVTHFSDYAVVYNQVSFKDVAAGAWYYKAVSFIAAREITTGTGGGSFSPEAKLTRGQFLVMLMKAYGIEPDANGAANFSDAGSTYYTGYLAAAKRLGIAGGVGNNLFAPEKEIIRQEMFTLLYNGLKMVGQLPQGDTGKTLSNFSDSGQIDTWAKEAMTLLVKTGTVSGSAGKLAPLSTTTRGEMAQVLYNLLSK
ncbi:MAG TPA: S-layer homology domain-containing protein [Negativicutes bacterium]|nr:S-layer homology domain-containing protein [Negativicutes bacterium]